MSDNVTKTFNIPKELASELRDSAQEEGVSESAIVRWALQYFFEAPAKVNQTKARKKS